jgi:hypothetical protein
MGVEAIVKRKLGIEHLRSGIHLQVEFAFIARNATQ